MSRRYEVKGTKEYLVGAIVLLALGLWAVRDGWFPSEAKLALHPVGEDSFYLFNKVLAVLCLTGSAVCAYIHMVVK